MVMSAFSASRVHQIAQHADDLGRAAAFYRDILGFRELAVFDPPGLAFFDLGNIRLLLEGGAATATLYLQVSDIGQAHAALLAKGVEFVDEPHMIFFDKEGQFGEPNCEEWMVFLRDSEGNLVGLVERRRVG